MNKAFDDGWHAIWLFLSCVGRTAVYPVSSGEVCFLYLFFFGYHCTGCAHLHLGLLWWSAFAIGTGVYLGGGGFTDCKLYLTAIKLENRCLSHSSNISLGI